MEHPYLSDDDLDAALSTVQKELFDAADEEFPIDGDERKPHYRTYDDTKSRFPEFNTFQSFPRPALTELPRDEVTLADRYRDTLAHGEQCTYWKSVSLSHQGSDSITDVGLVAMARTTPHLQQIDLTYAVGITEAGLIDFIGRVPELTHVVLRRCHHCTTDAVIRRLAVCCRNLQVLDVSYCHLVTDFALLAERCRSLRSLSVYGNSWISDDAVVHLANHCPTLQHLNIGKCQYLTNAAVAALATGRCSQQLVHVEVVRMLDLGYDTVVTLLESCRKLARLDVRSCPLSTTAKADDEEDENDDVDRKTRAGAGAGAGVGVGVVVRGEGGRSWRAEQWTKLRGDRRVALQRMFPAVCILTKWDDTRDEG